MKIRCFGSMRHEGLAGGPIGMPSALPFPVARIDYMKILVLNSGSSSLKACLYKVAIPFRRALHCRCGKDGSNGMVIRLSTDSVKRITVSRGARRCQINEAPGNNTPIGGLKVVARSGWFAARPSGTENICKIYAESFKDEPHLNVVIREAQEIVSNAIGQS